MFGTIGSSGGTADLKLIFNASEVCYAQNTQNTHDGCCQTVIYEVPESKNYNFTFTLSNNVSKSTLYAYIRYGYNVMQIA